MPFNPYIQYLAIVVVMVLVALLFESISCAITTIGSAIIVLIVSWKLNEIINRYFISKRVITSSERAVIISGCDSGFGNGVALKLNQLGFHTIALCLNASGDGVKQLISKAVLPNRLTLIEVDITDQSMIDRSFDTVSDILRDNKLKLWALVNNAGIFHSGFVEWDNSIDSFNQTFNVNTLGAIRLTRKYLPLLRESGGRVINVLSIFSRISMIGSAAYSASKFAALALNDSLRRELLRFGVKVISVEPSCYRTGMVNLESFYAIIDKVWSKTSNDVRNDYGYTSYEELKRSTSKQMRRARDPSEVVSALTDAIINEKPKIRYRCCGTLVKIIWSLSELLPIQVFDDLMRLLDFIDIDLE